MHTDPPARSPLLSTHHLSVHFGNRPAIEDVSVDILSGEVVSLLGPNGAGKSTLLKVLAGVIPPSHGTCTFRGRPVRGANQAVTWVPQRAGADWQFPISVIDAVLLGLGRSSPKWRGFNRTEREQALTALGHVQMEHFADVQIGALSGGQQQRVFLARALLGSSEVLLLDEPFTGVDVPTQDLFTALFATLTQRGVAIVYATHDLEQARRSSDRVLLINRTVVAHGTPDEVFHGDQLRQAFGGSIYILEPNNLVSSASRESR